MGLFSRKDKDSQRAQALAAKREAEAERDEVKSRWSEVRAEGEWHRWRRDENHFAESLARLMKGA